MCNRVFGDASWLRSHLGAIMPWSTFVFPGAQVADNRFVVSSIMQLCCGMLLALLPILV